MESIRLRRDRAQGGGMSIGGIQELIMQLELHPETRDGFKLEF